MSGTEVASSEQERQQEDKRWWGPAVGMDYSSHQQIEEAGYRGGTVL